MVAALPTLTALPAWANAKFLKLPMVIGVMTMALEGSLLLVAMLKGTGIRRRFTRGSRMVPVWAGLRPTW